MRKWLAMLRPSPCVTRRLLMLGVLAGVAVGAFCWGHYGALPATDAQTPSGPPATAVPARDNRRIDEYSSRVVGYVYGNIPVMREELGEYLIARFGAERLDFLINRKLVEMACKAQGITITDGQVDAQLIEDLKSFPTGMTLDVFVKQVLKRYNKTLYEWREDVIRPKLAMTALCKPLVNVTPWEVEQEFESKYGPKVQCRIIILQDGNKTVLSANDKIWQHASQSEAAFKEEATKQFIKELASKEGLAPPIFKHCSEKKLEEVAFSLQPGQISGLHQASDKTWFILRCEKHLPPDRDKRIEDERTKLYHQVYDKKLAAEIPRMFNRLRAEANPKNLLKREAAQRAMPAVSPVKMVAPPTSH